MQSRLLRLVEKISIVYSIGIIKSIYIIEIKIKYNI